jgi:MYXO-CTERM domain-containing protein
MRRVCVAALLCACAGSAMGQVSITEWMYSGLSGEYIEITNSSAAPVNMAGWSFDDDSRLPGVLDLSSLGVLAPGESAIITEVLDSDFRASWALPLTVKVLGGNITNLGRNDEINIFNGVDLVDRLTFGDQNILGTIRTQNIGGITSPSNWGTNNVASWFFASVGDAYGSYASTAGDIGNPGVIPTPGALALMGLGGLVATRRRR